MGDRGWLLSRCLRQAAMLQRRDQRIVELERQNRRLARQVSEATTDLEQAFEVVAAARQEIELLRWRCPSDAGELAP